MYYNCKAFNTQIYNIIRFKYALRAARISIYLKRATHLTNTHSKRALPVRVVLDYKKRCSWTWKFLIVRVKIVVKINHLHSVYLYIDDIEFEG